MPQEKADRKLRSLGREEGKPLYSPVFHEVRIDAASEKAEILRVCQTDFEVLSANKGFEAMEYLDTPSGDIFMGLCEGNLCEGLKDHAGHGMLVVMEEEEESKKGGRCLMKTTKTLKIPSVANFLDYSGLSFYPLAMDPKLRDQKNVGRLAITSQENAAMWVGDFDVEKLEIVGEGVTLHFPRDHDCNIRHCNIEGVIWVDEYRIVAVSDRTKATQPFWCEATDQTLSMFMLPHHFWKGPELTDDDEA